MSVVGATARDAKLAGFPLSSVLFAVRIWAATMLALLAAFWLQIDGAASAATCVAILAMQARGQVLQKAFYRLVGTVAGGAAAIALAALFSQERDLFLLLSAGWVASCVFAAALLDGNRAYGAQLSGYTVSLVAIQLIDAPQQVFMASANRCAAITVGIVAIALVNDVMAAPELRTGLLRRMRALHGQVRDFAQRSPHVDAIARDREAARLLAMAATLHPDVTALPTEATSGGARASAARRATIWMVRMILASRKPDDVDAAGLRAGTGGAEEIDAAITTALVDMETGFGSSHPIPLPIFRSRASAAHTALRTFLVLVLAGVLFSSLSWPSASLALSLVAVTMSLSATAPNARSFAIGAAIAMPLAIVAAGITEFIILDGATDFALLAIAMIPTVASACLLIATNRPPMAPVGFLLLVFFPIFLSPANPQNYNPQTYLVTAALALASIAVLWVGLTAVLPVDDADRRRWLLASAWADLVAVLQGRRHRAPTDLMRDADRIGQLAALRSGSSDPEDIEALFWCAAAADAAANTLSLVAGIDASWQTELRRAVRTLDGPLLRTCANHVADKARAPVLDHLVCLIYTRPAAVDRLISAEAA